MRKLNSRWPRASWLWRVGGTVLALRLFIGGLFGDSVRTFAVWGSTALIIFIIAWVMAAWEDADVERQRRARALVLHYERNRKGTLDD